MPLTLQACLPCSEELTLQKLFCASSQMRSYCLADQVTLTHLYQQIWMQSSPKARPVFHEMKNVDRHSHQ